LLALVCPLFCALLNRLPNLYRLACCNTCDDSSQVFFFLPGAVPGLRL
jgi:hypothetical protein